MNKKLPKAYYVEWRDAVSGSGWEDEHRLHKRRCFALGFLVRKGRGAIKLAACTDRQQVTSTLVIPRKMIRRMVRVHLPPTKWNK